MAKSKKPKETAGPASAGEQFADITERLRASEHGALILYFKDNSFEMDAFNLTADPCRLIAGLEIVKHGYLTNWKREVEVKEY